MSRQSIITLPGQRGWSQRNPRALCGIEKKHPCWVVTTDQYIIDPKLILIIAATGLSRKHLLMFSGWLRELRRQRPRLQHKQGFCEDLFLFLVYHNKTSRIKSFSRFWSFQQIKYFQRDKRLSWNSKWYIGCWIEWIRVVWGESIGCWYFHQTVNTCWRIAKAWNFNCIRRTSWITLDDEQSWISANG